MFFKHISSVSISYLLFLSLTIFTQAQSWTQLFPTGSIPTTRVFYKAIYDTANNRMTIFGGVDSTNINLNNVRVLNHANDIPTSVPKGIWKIFDK